MRPAVTISLPCFGRPARTRRAIECISNQTINNWEALIIGDGCSVFQEILESDWYVNWIADMEAAGNKVVTKNLERNFGGFGFHITNLNIQNATGEYFVFYANDDVILPNHLEHYLKYIEGTSFDFVYYNSYISPKAQLRWSNMGFGGVGHSELIIRTDFLKTLPAHQPGYGHDWSLIEAMTSRTKMYKKAESAAHTYDVRHLPQTGTVDEID
jgi:glycosyltransferase involved in cell wall biosynthesis